MIPFNNLRQDLKLDRSSLQGLRSQPLDKGALNNIAMKHYCSKLKGIHGRALQVIQHIKNRGQGQDNPAIDNLTSIKNRHLAECIFKGRQKKDSDKVDVDRSKDAKPPICFDGHNPPVNIGKPVKPGINIDKTNSSQPNPLVKPDILPEPKGNVDLDRPTPNIVTLPNKPVEPVPTTMQPEFQVLPSESTSEVASNTTARPPVGVAPNEQKGSAKNGFSTQYSDVAGDLESMFAAIQGMHAEQQKWAFTSKMESLEHQTAMSIINNA